MPLLCTFPSFVHFCANARRLGTIYLTGARPTLTLLHAFHNTKVLNWDVLGPDYLALEGLDSFVPTDVLTVPSTTFLVAAREETITEYFSAELSEESSPDFHYFLSRKLLCLYVCARADMHACTSANDFRTRKHIQQLCKYYSLHQLSILFPSAVRETPRPNLNQTCNCHVTSLIISHHLPNPLPTVPAEGVDPAACPAPCTGEVVSYYWSQSAGTVYLLDRVSAVAETQPCWLELFQTVAGGPPAGGVENALWEATGACTAGLLQGVEDAMKSGEYSSATSAALGDGDDDDGGGSAAVAAAAVAAAVLIPALLVSFAVVAFGFVRHQKAQRLKKMMTTEEAWGEGLDGGGARKPRPPTGRFMLGVAGAAVAAEGGGVAGGIARLKSFPPPERVFTDVSIDEEDGGVGMTAAAGEGGRDEEEGRVPEDDEEGEEDGDGEDMIYPM